MIVDALMTTLRRIMHLMEADPESILTDVSDRRSFRKWLERNHATEADCWAKFKRFPPLYQRVRAYNVAFYKGRDPEAYEKALANLIAHMRRGEMYGEWNDYGRLLGY
ncbi:MAG: hypothetical protein IJI68_12635 [Eggerthellaceae bacterium]|nr:hypothetical protein [Eggerthellaceae bacterium]